MIRARSILRCASSAPFAPVWTLALGLALALVGCTGEDGKSGRGGKRGRGGKPPAVAVAPVRVERVEERLIGHAALEADAIVDVTCQIEGEVKELLVQVGDAVKEGQVLARLDPERPELRLNEAALSVEQAQNTLKRRKTMHSQGVGSEEELETARTALKLAQLLHAQAKLDRQQVELRSTRSGVVLERSADLGTTLRAGDLAFRIADRTPLLARPRFPEAQAERVKVGQRAWITLEELKAPLPGRVIRVAPKVDLQSGTVIATVALEGDTSAIRLNRYATVELVVDAREKALTIPLNALAVRGREDQVLVVEADEKGMGKVLLREVLLGVRQGERVEVLSGLKAGEQVIVTGQDDLRPGATVRLLSEAGSKSVRNAEKTAKSTE